MIEDAQYFKQIRQEIGITQKQMAKNLGCGEVHICNIERGKISPSVTLKRCLEYLIQLNRLSKLLNK